jgi:Mg/Co/Ni transporter MgtE
MIAVPQIIDDPLNAASVGQLLLQEVCTADASETVGEALALLQTRGLTTEDYVAVCEGTTLIGVVRLSQLLKVAPAEHLGSMPITTVPSVSQSTTAEEAAWIAAHAAAEARDRRRLRARRRPACSPASPGAGTRARG